MKANVKDQGCNFDASAPEFVDQNLSLYHTVSQVSAIKLVREPLVQLVIAMPGWDVVGLATLPFTAAFDTVARLTYF